MPVAEPKIVVAHREDLWWLLAEACQLEHMIMCQYLFAEWTLKDKSDGLTDEQSEAIERWRAVLHGIAVEEMLHLALVANVMSSIGAAPYLGRANFPQRSGYFPTSIQLDLMPFGRPRSSTSCSSSDRKAWSGRMPRASFRRRPAATRCQRATRCPAARSS